ncbi:uncharacterized protein LOC126797451 [Argentina anserina]|uniref:uncharacterized protein LOC126797451 n=1 Tax=Argentina anserina TaxID=57926 RepID=UPI0021764949|nr:uncharacterized protein LOC126797451 [Potentilla anserina]
MVTIHSNLKPWHQSMTSNLQHYSHTTVSPLFTTKLNPSRISCTSSSEKNETSPAGRIKRLVLPQDGRTKLNTYPDRDFYAYPRFVTHVDDGFISTLTNLYREKLRPESEILDLMSSWVSHLPKEVQYKKVVGHGLNAQELSKNPRLDYFFVKDLNQDQSLELESSSFDAVFADVFRVLRPGGVFIVSFSNRLFYEKAIGAWRDGSAYSRIQLVVQYFQSVEGFTKAEVVKKLPDADGTKSRQSPFGWFMGLLGLLSGSDPFYAVIAYKNFKPIYETE